MGRSRSRAWRHIAIGTSCAIGLAVSLAHCGPRRFDGLTGGSPAPRLVHPLSGSIVFTKNPTLRWELPPGVEAVTVESCEDHECTTVSHAVQVRGTSTTALQFDPPDIFVDDAGPGDDDDGGAGDGADFPPAEYPDAVYWRVRADGRPPSPTWLVQLAPLRGKDFAWGTICDLNADGNPETLVGLPAEKQIAILPSDGILQGGDLTGVNEDQCTPNAPMVVLRQRPDEENFGGRVATGGDIDGDGYVDLLVSSLNPGLARSRAFVYFGAPGAAFLRDGDGVELSVESASPSFGAGLAGPGDVDGDGYGDVVVTDDNVVYVFWGSPAGPTGPTRLTVDGAPDFGCAASPAGDLDGDGFADFAVTACGAEGRVFVYFGGPDRGLPRRVELDRPPGIGGFGEAAVALAGDADRDGRSELFVGVPSIGRAFTYRASVGAGPRMELFQSYAGDGRPGFGFVAVPAFDTGSGLDWLWVGSEGDAKTLGQVTLWPEPGDLEAAFDGFDGVLPLPGRVVDIGPGVDTLVVSVAGADGQSRGYRGACEADGGFGAVEVFATSEGAIVFGH